jgi:hypothetical protein
MPNGNLGIKQSSANEEAVRNDVSPLRLGSGCNSFENSVYGNIPPSWLTKEKVFLPIKRA